MKSRTVVLLAVLITAAVACDEHVSAIDAAAVTQAQAGNPAGCPADAPAEDMNAACSLPAGTACAYRVPGGWQASVCGCYVEGEWASASQFGNAGCPDAQPLEGASCAGSDGFACPYFPDTVSYCTPSLTWSAQSEDPSWSCLDTSSPAVVDTSGVPGDTTLAALSAAEAETWCTWFVASWPWGDAPTADKPVASDGTVTGYAGNLKTSTGVCMEHLTVHHCVESLAAQTCAATIAALDDCVDTAWKDFHLVGHGCTPFVSTSGCSGTIIGTIDAVDGNCHVRVAP